MDSRTRRALTARANRLKPVLVVGRAGVTDAVAGQARRLLANTDLIKVRVEADTAGDASDLAEQLAEAVGAELVRRIGRAVILYQADSQDKAGGPTGSTGGQDDA